MDHLSQNTPRPARHGSWWLVFLGSVLAAMGAVFAGVLWTAWQRAEETRRWTAAPCKVVYSQLRPEQASMNSPVKYRVLVRYEYEAAGQHRSSERIHRVDGAMGDRDDAEAVRERYVPGQQLSCYVNPADPGFAVLEHDTRAALYTIWFPLLFVFGGLKMAWAALRR